MPAPRLLASPARVYLASALSNGDVNYHIAKSILALGYECYVPQDDPINSCPPLPGAAIAAKNRQEIENCGLLIAVSRGMGVDTSWEIGYAKGLGKPCFLLCTEGNTAEATLSPMPFFSVDGIISIAYWHTSESLVSAAVASVVDTFFSQLRNADIDDVEES